MCRQEHLFIYLIYLFLKIAYNSKAALRKLFSFKRCCHCKSKPLFYMVLLVMGQHCQPCPKTNSAASLPVPPDLGEDTWEGGLRLVCPQSPTPIL